MAYDGTEVLHASTSRRRGRDGGRARHQRLGEVDAAPRRHRRGARRVRHRVRDRRSSTPRGWLPERIAPLGVAMVPGGRGVFPSLSSRSTCAWPGGARATPRRSRPHSTGSRCCAPHGPKAAGNLSGGEQHKLALAMALVARPRSCWSTS